MLHWVGRAWLRLTGWRVEGQMPDLAITVVPVAPHSSNWDFVHAIAVVFALRLRVSFIGKHTLFLGPMGTVMRWLGGIPIDRSKPAGFAQDIAAQLRASRGTWLGVAPEGTRRAGQKFKTGFYRIAEEAGVPLTPVYIDYRRRRIGFLPPVSTTQDVDAGVGQIRQVLHEHGVRRDEARR